jgi:hypothetical protein
MKKTKKQNKILPEVHILGDLQDVKNLISGVNKKKTIVIFQDGDQGSFYLEIEGKFQPILQKDLKHLAKQYRLIYFLFFPSKKNAVQVVEDVVPEVTETEVAAIPEEKKEKKEKVSAKVKKMEKEKKEKSKK